MSCVVLPPSAIVPGTTTFEFDLPGGDAPRYTSMQRIHLAGGVHEEPPDPERLRFFYVLAGSGVFTGGETRAVRPGSAILLMEGEGGRLDSGQTGLTVLRVAVRLGAASPAVG